VRILSGSVTVVLFAQFLDASDQVTMKNGDRLTRSSGLALLPSHGASGKYRISNHLLALMFQPLGGNVHMT
jgi:hypothetical protein